MTIMIDKDQISFRTVLRGYDPGQVDPQIDELTALANDARARAETLADQVAYLTDALDAAKYEADHVPPAVPTAPLAPVAPSFADFGERVGQILTLAEQEADQIRSIAISDHRAQPARVRSVRRLDPP